jgi:hypothetical protein
VKTLCIHHGTIRPTTENGQDSQQLPIHHAPQSTANLEPLERTDEREAGAYYGDEGKQKEWKTAGFVYLALVLYGVFYAWALNLRHSFLYARSEDELNERWAEFQEAYKDPIFRPILQYIQSEWLNDCPKQFLHLYTSHYLHLGKCVED